MEHGPPIEAEEMMSQSEEQGEDATSAFIDQLSGGGTRGDGEEEGDAAVMDSAVTWMAEEVMPPAMTSSNLSLQPGAHGLPLSTASGPQGASSSGESVFAPFVHDPFLDESSKGEQWFLEEQSAPKEHSDYVAGAVEGKVQGSEITSEKEVQIAAPEKRQAEPENWRPDIASILGEKVVTACNGSSETAPCVSVESAAITQPREMIIASEDDDVTVDVVLQCRETANGKISFGECVSQGSEGCYYGQRILNDLNDVPDSNNTVSILSQDEVSLDATRMEMSCHLQCDVSRELPDSVKKWSLEKGESIRHLLTCSRSETFVAVKALQGTVSMTRDDISNGVTTKHLEKKIIVLKRCGVRNDDLKSYDCWSICPNHLQLLTTDFPIEDMCQICRSQLGCTSITPFQQDLLCSFIPGVIVGQLACNLCLKKTQSLVNKGLTGTKEAFVRALFQDGLISDDKYKGYLPSVYSAELSSAYVLWVNISLHNPSMKLQSAVPPLRFLVRGIQSMKPLEVVSELTIKDIVDLRLTMRNNAHLQLDLANKLLNLGFTKSWYEFCKIADAFIMMIDTVEQIKNSCLTEELKTNCAKKIKHVLTLKFSQVLLYPDVTGLKHNVWYKTNDGEETTCLFCATMDCRGCSDSLQKGTEREVEGDCVAKLLSQTCRLCKGINFEKRHICLFGSCSDSYCKFTYKEQILNLYGFDVDLDSPKAHPSLICSECKVFLTKKRSIGEKRTPPEFIPHDCKINRRAFCTTAFVTVNDVVSVSNSISVVPSLRLICTGIFEDPLQDSEMWKHITVQTGLDIAGTVMEISKSCPQDADQLFLRLLRKGILLPTSRKAFHCKVTDLLHLLKFLQEEGLKRYPHKQTSVAFKIRHILALKFYDCDPWCMKSKTKIGIWVLDRTAGSKFLCCQCPSSDCNGNCVVPFKNAKLPTILKQSDKAFDLSQKESGYENHDSSYIPETSLDVNIEEAYVETIDSPCDDASFYYTASNSTDITFDFLYSDYNAVYQYLVCQSDPAFWSVTESKHELFLEREGQGVHVKIRTNEQKGRTVCKFTGPGIKHFVDDLLPTLIKLTSSKYLELDSQNENGNTTEDEPATSLQMEMIFVEEMSESSAASDHLNLAAASQSQRAIKLLTRKSGGNDIFECRGCRQKFKYENSYIKHESKCNNVGIPQDVRSFPDLKDGRKPCPGCGKTFADANLSYLKHVRVCSKIKPDFFKCKTCPATFSTAKTLAKHAAMCAKYRKRKGVIVPQLTKRLKIESVVSLTTAPPLPSSPAPAPTKSRMTWKWKVEKHRAICKIGNYKCPLCKIRYKLNQPYGKHVKSQECLKRKQKKAPDRENFNMMFITIHPGIKGDDSVIGFNRVPSLRMLCRGVQAKKSIIKINNLPPLTIKEGLEVYYSLKRSDKSLDREDRWIYLTTRYIFQNFGTSTAFLNSGATVLKSVNYFEEKVKTAKAARNATLMKKWNDKLNTFLAMPYHDNFNTVAVSKFRAFEYPSRDGTTVEVLCFNCCDSSCRGCHQSRVAVKAAETPSFRTPQSMAQPLTPNPIKPAIKKAVVPTPKKSSSKGLVEPPAGVKGTQNQIAYFNAVKIWKSKEELKNEYLRVGELLGYKRPASLTEVVNFELGQLAPKTTFSHYCSSCANNFNNPQDLVDHQATCGGSSQEEPSFVETDSHPEDVNRSTGSTAASLPTEVLFSVVDDSASNTMVMETETTGMPWMLPDQECNVADDECILPD